MKYFKTLGYYKNSTGTNYYHPEKEIAKSYDWWQYLRRFRINDAETVLIFNDSFYSQTTRKHQTSLRSIIDCGSIDLVLKHTDINLSEDIITVLRAEYKASQIKRRELLDKCKRGQSGSKANQYRLDGIKKIEEQQQKIILLLKKTGA